MAVHVFCSRLVFVLCGLAAFLVSAAVPGHVLADEVRLKNGDRISGRVLKKDNGVLAVKTSYAGTIVIKWSDVSRIIMEQPVEVSLKDKTVATVQEIAEEPGVGPAGPDALPAGDIQYINPPPYITGRGLLWAGHLTLGYWASDGNVSKKHFNIDGELRARTERQRYTLAGAYLFVQDEGVETESRATGSAKLDHFFNEKWYGIVHVTMEKDRFKDINLRALTGAGLGYQFWESKRRNLAVESGLDYVVVDYRQADDEEYPAWRWALNFDTFLFSDRLQFYHNHQFNVGLEDTKDLLFSSRTGVRIPLMSNLNATMAVHYDWANQPADDKKRGDTTYLFSLGYFW